MNKELQEIEQESIAINKEKRAIEQKQEYRKMCYNFEYKFGSNVPHCAKKDICNGDCEYMRNFK